MNNRNNLRLHRMRSGFSQLELARKTRIAPGIISNLENNKQFPYKGWRKRIAKALNVAEKEIFPVEVAKDFETRKR